MLLRTFFSTPEASGESAPVTLGGNMNSVSPQMLMETPQMTKPSHHAPTHRGSRWSMPGSRGIQISSLCMHQNLSKATAKITKRLQDFTNEGSGWRLKRCARVDVGIVQYRPFRGRSYIKTPAYISSRTVINVRNQDNRCFEWAILSAVYPVTQNPHRLAKYQDHLGELNFTGISFPVRLTDVRKFERQNPGLLVNVFGWKVGSCNRPAGDS